jgi:hypothetical protein
MSNGSDQPLASVAWMVSCPRHGERAHLHLEDLAESRPELLHCSLRPSEFPPTCDQDCMTSFRLTRGEGSESGRVPDPSQP